MASAARIAVSWCSGCVDSRGGYVGAFVGKANAGLVTNSYYDTSANGSMEAAGKNSGGSTAYAGITPIGLGEKYSAASYPSFDFTNTWSIAEGVDEPRLMPPTGYKDFLDDCYLPLNTDPLFVMNGIPAGIRYIYDIPDEATSLIPMRHDALDDTWKPADGLRRPAMFFKWRVTVARVDE